VALLSYWTAWLSLALGDSARAARELSLAGCNPSSGVGHSEDITPGPLAGRLATETLWRMEREMRSHALDPAIHGILADALFAEDPLSFHGLFEALAVRLLAPVDAAAWRRWGLLQARMGHPQQAYASLVRSRELAGESRDLEVEREIDALRRGLPGQSQAQAALGDRPRH
jgi:hypothetical protein